MKFFNKNSMYYIAFFMISLLYLEDVYTPSEFGTGKYSHVISILLLSVLILFYVGIPSLRNKEIYGKENRIQQYFLVGMIGLMVMSYVFKHGQYLYAIRYVCTVIIIYLALHIKNFPLELFSKVVIVLGGTFSLFVNHSERIDGFLKSSPTLFSILVLTACIYIFEKKKSNWEYGYVVVGLGLIYFTATRSTLLVFLVYLGIKIILRYVNLKSTVSYIIAGILGLGVLGGSIFLFNNFELRENQHGSTSSRVAFLQYGIDELQKEPTGMITGYGVGRSMTVLHSRIGVYTPLHFDPLTFWVDYGIIGLIATIFLPFLLGRFGWQGWLLYGVGWFHNILLFPLGVFFIFQVGSSIAREKYSRNLVESDK